MPGFRGGSSYAAVGVLGGYSGTAVTASQNLNEMAFPWSAGRIGGIAVKAATAGTGGASTVVDVLLNGTSIWTTGTDRPTLAATQTGAFTMAPPNVRGLKYEDTLTIQVATISSTGHARVAVTVGLEKA